MLGDPSQQQTALKESLQRDVWQGWGRQEAPQAASSKETSSSAEEHIIPFTPLVLGVTKSMSCKRSHMGEKTNKQHTNHKTHNTKAPRKNKGGATHLCQDEEKKIEQAQPIILSNHCEPLPTQDILQTHFQPSCFHSGLFIPFPAPPRTHPIPAPSPLEQTPLHLTSPHQAGYGAAGPHTRPKKPSHQWFHLKKPSGPSSWASPCLNTTLPGAGKEARACQKAAALLSRTLAKSPSFPARCAAEAAAAFPPQRKGATRQTESLGNEVPWWRLPGAGRDAPKKHPANLNNVNLLPKPHEVAKPLAAVLTGEPI